MAGLVRLSGVVVRGAAAVFSSARTIGGERVTPLSISRELPDSCATSSSWQAHSVRAASGWVFRKRKADVDGEEGSGGIRSAEGDGRGSGGVELSAGGDGISGGGGLSEELSTSPAAASAVAAGVAVSGEAAGEVGPIVGSAIGVIDALHAGTGLPWWATLMLLGSGVRLSLVPLSLQQELTAAVALRTRNNAHNNSHPPFGAVALSWGCFLAQARSLEGNLKLWGQAQGKAASVSTSFVVDASNSSSEGRALPAQVLSETGSATIESQAGERGKQGDRKEVAGRKPDLRATWREFSALRAETVAPSLWWIPGVPAVQILLFATNAMAVRSMAVQQWPGFATEGLMWFSDLTQPAMVLMHNAAPMGTAGGLLPMAVLSVYLANIHRSFGGAVNSSAIAQSSSDQQSVMLWLRPKLRLFLEWLCVGMLWFGFQAPQALLLYVLSSASFALAQGSGPGRYVTRAALGPLFGLPPVGQQTALARDSLQADASRSEAVRKLFQHAAELRAKDDIAGAVSTVEQLLEIEPRNARAYFALGKLHSKDRQWGESEAAYLRSVELEEDGVQQGRAFFGAGIALYNQEEYDVAVDALQKALERCPDDAEALLSLSAALAKVAKFEDSRAAVMAAAEQDPMVKEHLMDGLLADLDKAERAAVVLESSSGKSAAEEDLTHLSGDEPQAAGKGGDDLGFVLGALHVAT
eukprot:CAMPEP_0177758044 /NCGR_PEP_ID=MMETSP0491_2-20121128/3977_1 /TAXON_ID=63592 /ORGANISM="Tetraselmis chuii, Strain PLY429" /LENGTH=695 /DNA_ID=CAMNT_0019273757 /DNA_START=90 /DNA_END=2180 /DNA_ORIENTATION=-